jgi:hypothetical protein
MSKVPRPGAALVVRAGRAGSECLGGSSDSQNSNHENQHQAKSAGACGIGLERRTCGRWATVPSYSPRRCTTNWRQHSRSMGEGRSNARRHRRRFTRPAIAWSAQSKGTTPRRRAFGRLLSLDARNGSVAPTAFLGGGSITARMWKQT